MSHMRKLWEREHVISTWERERKAVTRLKHRRGIITTREFDAARAEIETQAADARSEMFAEFLLR
jgi:hypothetical protein